MNLTDEQLAELMLDPVEVAKQSTVLMNEYAKLSPDKHINEIALLLRTAELTAQFLGLARMRVILVSALFAAYNMGRKDEAEAEESALDTFKKGLDE